MEKYCVQNDIVGLGTDRQTDRRADKGGKLFTSEADLLCTARDGDGHVYGSSVFTY